MSQFKRTAALFNIRNKDHALKGSWVFKLKENSVEKWLANTLMENKIGDNVWQSIMRPEDIKLTVSKQNFWMDVRYAWSKLTFDGPLSKDQVKNQFLWLNSNIQVGN